MKRGGRGRTRVAIILAAGVSLSLVIVFFFTASPWTPPVDDQNAERMFATMGAVIGALAVWLGGTEDDHPPPPPADEPPPARPAVDTGDDE